MARQTTHQPSPPTITRPTREQADSLIELLHSWRDGDAEEQRETLEYLMRVLDEDRPSDRKLFPQARR